MSKVDLNVSPYWDDFESSDRFHQILYKPGLPVQARELTQMQSIQKNQLKEFGQHVFREGSIVSGGQIRHTSHLYVSLSSTAFDGVSTFDVADLPRDEPLYFVSKNTIGGDVLVEGQLSYFDNETNSIFYNATTFLNVPEVASNQIILIYDAEQFLVYQNGGEAVPLAAARVREGQISYYRMVASIDEGVTFYNGMFVQHSAQHTVISRDTATPTAIIGFEVEETIVTPFDDPNLLDPAQGSSNYAAPGADRLQVTLTLTSIPWTGTDSPTLPETFIETLRLIDGEVASSRRVPLYSDIMDTFARRTFDESGNYTVRAFHPSIKTFDDFEDTITVQMSSGKGYVRGYEIDIQYPVDIEIDKALDTETASGFDVTANYGNKVNVVITTTGVAPFALPNLNQPSILEIRNISDVVIGQAVVRTIARRTDGVFELYLIAVDMSNGAFSDARSFTFTSVGQIRWTATIHSSSIVNGVATISDANLTPGLFLIPQGAIQQVSNINYYTKTSFSSVTITDTQAVIQTSTSSERFVGASGGLVPTSIVNTTFIVLDKSTGEVIDMTLAGRSIEIPVPTAAAVGTAILTFDAPNAIANGTQVDVIATIDKTDVASRAKLFSVSGPTLLENVAPRERLSLGAIDVQEVVAFEGDDVAHTFDSIAFSFTCANKVVSTSIPFGSIQPNSDVLFVFNGNDAIYSKVVSWFDQDGFVAANVNMADSTGTGTAHIGTLVNDIRLLDGQRDSFYDVSTFEVLRDEPSFIQLFTMRFSHSGSKGPFTINSYGGVPAHLIPTYISTNTSAQFNLASCYDFRWSRTNPPAIGTPYDNQFVFGTQIDIPLPVTPIDASIQYYLGRIDVITLMSDGTFRVVRGLSDLLSPKAPPTPELGMRIANVQLSPQTVTVDQVILTEFDNRRYTMADIGEIKNRVDRLEYYTTLNMLEKEVSGSPIFDAEGNQVFNNGFVVDGFVSTETANLLSAEFKCNIDTKANKCEPTQTVSFVELDHTAGSARHIGSIVTPQYFQGLFTEQMMATGFINVNHSITIQWVGDLRLDPESDIWEVTSTTDRTVRVTGNTNRTTTTRALVSTETIPWVRSRDVDFVVEGVKPRDHLKIFYNGVDISQFSAEIFTDAKGRATGAIHIPNEDNFRFPTGDGTITLAGTSNLDDLSFETSIASSRYITSGTLQNWLQTTTITTAPQPRRWPAGDPVAQSFSVSADAYPLGVMLTSLDLYFWKKDSVEPVLVEVRPMVNGYPDSENIVRFGTASLAASDVITTETGQQHTRFTFDAPVYLEPGKEYAFVVKANTPEYWLYKMTLGEIELTTGRRASRVTQLGSLFFSQDAKTWSADQSSDLKFRLNKANFFTNVAYTSTLSISGSVDEDIVFSNLETPPFEVIFGGGNQTAPMSTSYQITARDTGGTFNTLPYQLGTSLNLGGEHTIRAGFNDDLTITASLTTQSFDVAPVLRIGDANARLFYWNINSEEDVLQATVETDPIDGSALAKYVTKTVTLADNIDANHLYVYAKANRPQGTTIKVYAKVLHASDGTIFTLRPWIEIPAEKVTKTVTDEYNDNKFSLENISYVDGASSYNGFRTFAIKVVFYSQDQAFAPSINDLRVIAGS